MASRSFKPTSYLASAAQRPSFTRTSSVSSTRSEDSFVGPLTVFSLDDQPKSKSKSKQKSLKKSQKENSHASSPGRHSHEDKIVTTPGRKRSAPIAISLPGRDPRAVYTPLSARGDLPGGYFPNHEEITRSYKSHPFNNNRESKPESPFVMSFNSTPVSETVPMAPQSILSPGFPPELTMPMGKYHPSNFKSQPTSTVTTPGTTVPAPFPSNNLSLTPKSANKRPTTTRGTHERRDSDVKRKLQQYQRDMIAQARMAGSTISSDKMAKVLQEPDGPKLEPLGSPGPITPFELEESDEYLIAGSSNATNLRNRNSKRQSDSDIDLVESIIDAEAERQRNPRTKI